MNGLVNHRRERCDFRNLHVDQAVVSKVLGLNPSKTIAASAEQIAAVVVHEGW